MDQFDILLEMFCCQCNEVEALSVMVAGKFSHVTIVRGVSCSYRDS